MLRISLKPLIPICFLFLHIPLSYADEAGSAKSQEVILSNHQLGPGDEIRIHVYDEQELSLEIKLTNAGTYFYHPGFTVQKAVSLAGGFSERASRSSITIVRD